MTQNLVSMYVKLAVFIYSVLFVSRLGRGGIGILLQLASPLNQSECKPAI